MKIAVIGAKGLPPKQGGIEHYCAGVYPRMVAQGHEVDLFGRSSYTDFPAFHEHTFEGVRTISMPSLSMRGMDALASSAIGAVMASKTHYDIVHFHALGPSLFTWLPVQTLAGDDDLGAAMRQFRQPGEERWAKGMKVSDVVMGFARHDSSDRTTG